MGRPVNMTNSFYSFDEAVDIGEVLAADGQQGQAGETAEHRLNQSTARQHGLGRGEEEHRTEVEHDRTEHAEHDACARRHAQHVLAVVHVEADAQMRVEQNHVAHRHVIVRDQPKSPNNMTGVQWKQNGSELGTCGGGGKYRAEVQGCQGPVAQNSGNLPFG